MTCRYIDNVISAMQATTVWTSKDFHCVHSIFAWWMQVDCLLLFISLYRNHTHATVYTLICIVYG